MSIFISTFNPPAEHEGEGFRIFPTDSDFHQSDYEAVMRNKENLRLWSQSSWPEEHFSLEENKSDLELHMQDNQSHSAYGYMIYSQDLKDCYGSLYINSLRPIPDNYLMTPNEVEALDFFDLRVDYWITEEIPGMEELMTKEIYAWIQEVWKLPALFSSRKEMVRRQELYKKLGLNPLFDLKGRTSGMSLLLYST
jgi:hypothetical protein